MRIGLGLKEIQIDVFILKVWIIDTMQSGQGRGGGHHLVYRQKVAFNTQFNISSLSGKV